MADGALHPGKFRDPFVTAKGEPRAHVRLERLSTLWFNTGTLCNIACANCYIESSPTNDALVYLTPEDMAPFLADTDASVEIGFTGGEPFLNPHILALLRMPLERGRRVLVLTNAMRPMMRPRVQAGLLELRAAFGDRLVLRVSLDHPEPEAHDRERGAGAWDETAEGLDWLTAHGFSIAIAGRLWGRADAEMRTAFGAAIAARRWAVRTLDPPDLILFPEMDARVDVPEITTACWGILHKSPSDVMCATSRMVVRRRGEAGARVVACTLLPHDPRFDLGASLADAAQEVALNHPHCAKFCVLGGGRCAG